MRSGRSALRRCAVLLAGLAALGETAARADDAPEPRSPRVGIGWQGGNGLGLVGADVIVFASPRLAVDLQLAFHREDLGYASLTSYAIAPSVRAYLRPEGFTPYAGLGVAVVRKTAGSLAWSRTGVFANVGPEWRSSSGARFFLGAGIAYWPAVSASNASEWIAEDRYLGFNLELGVRFMLL